MKKGTMITLLVIVVLAAAGGTWYHHAYGKTWYYGQVGSMERYEKQPDGNPTTYYYLINGWNKDGQHKRMEVGSVGGHRFVKGRYIKVGWSRAQKVATYEQVQRNEIPKKALQHLE
ncbi:YxeA family protein [Lentilactobacillus kisonensis]|uniref:YxeA family protein n=2 Tax=Lentilactobacillus kisonensis TaxID=481722 RepID=H1LJ59_9LACO|nr:YxeA family protein [Lentilactobacillus kisonensis]EHO49146.1 hypothetical protein HMPREF9104_02651 [Lentilactobacillus kisonensis F0435]KRL23068.1 hypothetical protein FC98_GL001104 [Lentilactobacillus kisonensis DSM 19906 = JCM 15041]